MGSTPTQWTFIFWVERWKKQWTSKKQLVYKLGFFTYLIFGASKWTSRFNMIQLTQAKHSETGQWGIASSWAFLAAAAFACRIHWMAGDPGAKRPFGWNSPPNALQFVVKALVNWRKMQEHIKNICENMNLITRNGEVSSFSLSLIISPTQMGVCT